MMRRTPLARGTKPLRRTTRLRARSKTNAYRRRERDVPYMRWVKRLACVCRALPPETFVSFIEGRVMPAKLTPCTGRVEADHAGERGMGQKADDRTCIPMCSSHHAQRHAHNGAFKHLNRDELRAWRTEAITRTQIEWSNR